MSAQRGGVDKESYLEMESPNIFGTDLRWALRDAIKFSGNYDQIIKKNFPHVDLEGDDRGRNKLIEGGPMIHSYPGLNW